MQAFIKAGLRNSELTLLSLTLLFFYNVSLRFCFIWHICICLPLLVSSYKQKAIPVKGWLSYLSLTGYLLGSR